MNWLDFKVDGCKLFEVIPSIKNSIKLLHSEQQFQCGESVLIQNALVFDSFECKEDGFLKSYLGKETMICSKVKVEVGECVDWLYEIEITKLHYRVMVWGWNLKKC